jgi:hypothetical protein
LRSRSSWPIAFLATFPAAHPSALGFSPGMPVALPRKAQTMYRRRPPAESPMWEERFDRVDQRLDRLEVRQDNVEQRLERLDVRQEKVEQRLERLETGQDDLRRHMLVLHEEVIATIRAIPDPEPRLQRMWKADIAGLREEVFRHIDPLEAAVRNHFKNPPRNKT